MDAIDCGRPAVCKRTPRTERRGIQQEDVQAVTQGPIARRHLPYTPQQLFDLVADVEKYPDFLPWIADSSILRQEGNRLWVNMTIGSGLLRKRFASVGVLEPPEHIWITSDDPLFDRFEQIWTFSPAAAGGSTIEYRVDFKFRSRLLQAMMGSFLDDASRATIGAFERRALHIYGAGTATGETDR
jgi:coenzyme Q-binding protein COQ10